MEESVTLSAIVSTTYYRGDFKTQRQWEKFLTKIAFSKAALQNAFYDGIEGKETKESVDATTIIMNIEGKNQSIAKPPWSFSKAIINCLTQTGRDMCFDELEDFILPGIHSHEYRMKLKNAVYYLEKVGLIKPSPGTKNHPFRNRNYQLIKTS